MGTTPPDERDPVTTALTIIAVTLLLLFFGFIFFSLTFLS